MARLAAVLMGVAALAALGACTTSGSGSSGNSSGGGGNAPREPRGIAGEWRMQADDTILTCRIVISPGQGRGEGRAEAYGCIGPNAFEGFLRRWEREGGRVRFYSFGADGPVAAVRRVDRDTFRGRFIPSGRQFELTRR